MRDFNFFSPYIEVKKGSKVNTLNVVIIACSVILLFSSVLIVNQLRINSYNREIKNLTTYLSSSGTIKKLNEYDETKKRVQMLNEYNVIVVNINKQIDNEDVVGTTLMNDIAKAFPGGTFVKSMTLNNKGMELQGVANSRTAVAELEHNLLKITAFSSVHVSNIAEDSGSLNNVDASGQASTGTVNSGSNNYTFAITCKMGDVKK